VALNKTPINQNTKNKNQKTKKPKQSSIYKKLTNIRLGKFNIDKLISDIKFRANIHIEILKGKAAAAFPTPLKSPKSNSFRNVP